MSDFPRLLQLISQEDQPLIQFFATAGFRRVLSLEHNAPLQKVIDNNLVPKFITFIARDDMPKIQFEAAWCLTNLASGEHKHAQILLDHGAIEPLITLLTSQHLTVVEQAILCLGNLAGDNSCIRNIIIERGAVEPIANLLLRITAGSSFIRNASWTLSNLCRGRPGPPFMKIKNAIPALAKVMIENDSSEILTDICWAFSYITDGGQECIPFIIASNALQRII